MLPYVLAIAIGVSSLTFYFTAFFKPEVHRQDDFLWSGVGLFYALVLWVCAPRITGAILLGQTASVLLLLWYGWQTLKLRRAIANPELAAEIESFSLLEWIQNRFDNLFSKPQLPVTTPPVSENVDNSIEEILEDEPITEVIEQKTTIQAEKTPTKSEKSGGFGKMFSGVTGVFRKSKPATVTPDDSQSIQPTDTTIPVSDDLVT